MSKTKSSQRMEKYVTFLRGINVGAHHRVPMAKLRSELEEMGFKKVTTILNSGNILFESDHKFSENEIANQLESVFGFPIPTITRKFETIAALYHHNPFENVELSKTIRLYISFLQKEVNIDLSLPWKSDDSSFTLIEKKGKSIFSVLDLSLGKTPKAMEAIEKHYGKDITTRNWNTISRIMKKASTQGWL